MGMAGTGELAHHLTVRRRGVGANKLPKLGDGIGKPHRSLKRGLDHDDDDELDVTPSEHA
jgi:hypothetical protein